MNHTMTIECFNRLAQEHFNTTQWKEITRELYEGDDPNPTATLAQLLEDAYSKYRPIIGGLAGDVLLIGEALISWRCVALYLLRVATDETYRKMLEDRNGQ